MADLPLKLPQVKHAPHLLLERKKLTKPSLTSSVHLTQVWKTPHISKSNGIGHTCQNKLHGVIPRLSRFLLHRCGNVLDCRNNLTQSSPRSPDTKRTVTASTTNRLMSSWSEGFRRVYAVSENHIPRFKRLLCMYSTEPLRSRGRVLYFNCLCLRNPGECFI